MLKVRGMGTCCFCDQKSTAKPFAKTRRKKPVTEARTLLSSIGKGPGLSPAAATHLLTQPLRVTPHGGPV